MINLLTKENRKLLKLSYYNNFLVKIILMLIVTLMAISGMFIYASLTLDSQEESFKSQIENNNTKFTDLNKIENKANSTLKKLNQAKIIFNDQKHYSVFLTELSKALPNNVSINYIAISPDITKNPASVIIHTQDYETILSAKKHLESSDLIESVSIRSVANRDDEKNKKKDTVLLLKFNKEGVEKALKW